MISLAFALFGLANAEVSLSTRQNDAQFERRQTVSSAAPLSRSDSRPPARSRPCLSTKNTVLALARF